MKGILLVIVFSAAITGCGETVCAGVGLARILPADTTIAVGASFIARYQEGATCSPGHVTDADYYPVPVTWRTADTLVVRVDAATGRVTGVGIGDAHVTSDERLILLGVHVR